MPNLLFIGLKSSEYYSPEMLAYLGLIAEATIMGKQSFGDFTGETYTPERGARLMLPENQAALMQINKIYYAEFGRNLVAFLNGEHPTPELNIQDEKITLDDDLASKIITRTVEIICRKHSDFAQDINREEESNDVTRLLKAVENFNKLDQKFPHALLEIKLSDFLPDHLTAETDPDIIERHWALAVLKQLFIYSSKLNRTGAINFVDSIKNANNVEEIIDTIEYHIRLFYESPINKLILQIEEDIVAKIREDETLHRYLDKIDKKNPKNNDPKEKKPFEINSFNEFVEIFYNELDKFIKEWIKTLIENSNNKLIDEDKYRKHEASIIQHRAELLSWLEYLSTFFNELEPYEERIEKLIDSIKSFGNFEEDNSILELLNDLNELIQIKLSYFEKFARIYIDSAALVNFESSEDQNFQEFKRELLLAEYVINHFYMIKNAIAKWDEKRDALSQEVKQLNSSEIPPSSRPMVLTALLKPIVSLTGSILDTFRNTKGTLSRTPQLLDLDLGKISYSQEISQIKQANSENRQFYQLNLEKLKTEKAIAKRFFKYFTSLIEKCETTFKIQVENFKKYASEITQSQSFSNNHHLHSSPIHSRSDEDSHPAKKAKLNNKGKEEENDEEINPTPPFMA